jgi:hypothetical protein
MATWRLIRMSLPTQREQNVSELESIPNVLISAALLHVTQVSRRKAVSALLAERGFSFTPTAAEIPAAPGVGSTGPAWGFAG